jgi:hypothetical protein
MAVTICLTDATADKTVSAIERIMDAGPMPSDDFNALRAVYAQLKKARGKPTQKQK